MLPRSIQQLILEFGKLPGVGPKTAARLTFYLLSKPQADIKRLGQSVSQLKDNLFFCDLCYNISETNPCDVCSDGTRNKEIICVVEEPLDVLAVEKANFRGQYHVLGGVISPIDDIGPENLRIKELFGRLANNSIAEVILATDPSLEGEATAMYISREIAKLKIKNLKIKNLKITRLARGLPVGGDLEYTDEVTLSRALEGRREF